MPIRVHKVKGLGDGSLELSIHGQEIDGKYVAGRLKSEKGVRVTEPNRQSGTEGVFVYVIAKGTDENPLSRQRVIEILQADPEIEMVNVD
jgi:hypothetical protein